jgi:hypothetical protein
MKRLFFSLLVAGLLASCGGNKAGKGVESDAVNVGASAEGRQESDLPEIKFAEEAFDFGRITQGERVSHSFVFENTGKRELIVSGASGSCGCTVPEWPRQPIPPGGKGEIGVVFNSEGKSGYQEKTISVITNCEPATRIVRIKAEVVVPESSN